jgi:hypothetical protein
VVDKWVSQQKKQDSNPLVKSGSQDGCAILACTPLYGSFFEVAFNVLEHIAHGSCVEQLQNLTLTIPLWTNIWG